MKAKNIRPIVETRSGQRVSLVNPEAINIDLDDIAHALSKISRYNGHTRSNYGYSVAQHSVWVAHAITYITHKADEDHLKAALLHDAHEAYTGDIISPLKQLMEPKLSCLQNKLDVVIFDALNVLPPSVDIKQDIKQVDLWALALEARKFMRSGGTSWNIPDAPNYMLPDVVDPMPPHEAYHYFMAAWEGIEDGELPPELYG